MEPTTLAHMGGVPEALTVLVPLALVVIMLRMGAKKTPPEDGLNAPPASTAADGNDVPPSPAGDP